MSLLLLLLLLFFFFFFFEDGKTTTTTTRKKTSSREGKSLVKPSSSSSAASSSLWRVLLQRFISRVRPSPDFILFKEKFRASHKNNLYYICKTLTQTYANVCLNVLLQQKVKQRLDAMILVAQTYANVCMDGLVGYNVRFTSPFPSLR